MDCGSQELFCQLTGWLSENELVAPWLVEVIGRLGGHADGLAGAAAQFIRDYGQSIVGLIGVTFGFWRWWRYREHILHKRLAEYLSENDARLNAGTADLIELIQRPAPGQQFKDPLFIDGDLRVVLRERNWDKPAYAIGVAASSDWQLEKAIDSINRRLRTAQQSMTSLHHQLSSAYTIRGAIAASRGDRTGSGEFYRIALNFFRSALNVPQADRNIVLEELEAHQQRKLGLSTAAQSFRTLFERAETIANPRDRRLAKARARRFMAEIEYSSSSWNAWLMMTAVADDAQFFPGALSLIETCEPLEGWDRLEKGHMHYFAARCAHERGFVAAEPFQLGEAEANYRQVVIELSHRRRWRRMSRRLARKAREGIKRVAEARNGSYDVQWLSRD